MGYNTALMLCNDGMDQLLRDPDAGRKIYDGVLNARRLGGTIGLGNHCNPMMALPSEHADVDQLVIVGGNYIRPVLSHWGAFLHNVPEVQLQEAVMRELAHRLGYTVRKKK